MATVSDPEIQAIVQNVLQKMGVQPTSTSTAQSKVTQELSSPISQKMVAIGSDHGGFALKEIVKPYLIELGYQYTDCGPADKNPVDYPDYALAVAQQISSGRAFRGIMIDGAGIGSCMVANKVPGIRAAMCYDISTAINSREHNDANVLTLGAGLIGENLAKQIVKTWLSTDFGGGRHAKRVEKIMALEKQFLRGSEQK
jgi:ribose 5-phosphate isomerase B